MQRRRLFDQISRADILALASVRSVGDRGETGAPRGRPPHRLRIAARKSHGNVKCIDCIGHIALPSHFSHCRSFVPTLQLAGSRASSWDCALALALSDDNQIDRNGAGSIPTCFRVPMANVRCRSFGAPVMHRERSKALGPVARSAHARQPNQPWRRLPITVKASKTKAMGTSTKSAPLRIPSGVIPP